MHNGIDRRNIQEAKTQYNFLFLLVSTGQKCSHSVSACLSSSTYYRAVCISVRK